MCSAAQSAAVLPVKGRTRPSNARTVAPNQARNALPCGGVRRSSNITPFSNSRMLMADRYN